MKSNREYRALAREHMKGSYGQGIIIMLAIVMAQSVIQGILKAMAGESVVMITACNILNIIIAAIIFNPLLVGTSKFFLEQAQDRPDMNNVFMAFRTNLNNVVKVSFIRDIKLILWFVPFFAILFFITAELEAASVIVRSAMFMPIVIVLMIPGIVKSVEYSIINYILAENPDIKSKTAFIMAREMMRGNKGRLFLLELSFIGWIALGLMAFGVGIFLVIPYEEAAVAHFYLDAKAQAINTSMYGSADNKNFDDGDTFGL